MHNAILTSGSTSDESFTPVLSGYSSKQNIVTGEKYESYSNYPFWK